jgi:hypothetical protein
VAEQKFKPAPAPRELVGAGVGGREPRPDASAKFDAGAGVEGDISSVVGGASNKPIPSAPKRIEPKGGMGDHTGGLLAAKRRAQEKIKQQQEE